MLCHIFAVIGPPLFFPMLPVIPAECPFWPPIRCIDYSVWGGCWWIMQAAEDAQVLIDEANVLEHQLNIP